MKFRTFRRALARNRAHHRTPLHAALTTECCDELAMIADRRRSDLVNF